MGSMADSSSVDSVASAKFERRNVGMRCYDSSGIVTFCPYLEEEANAGKLCRSERERERELLSELEESVARF